VTVRIQPGPAPQVHFALTLPACSHTVQYRHRYFPSTHPGDGEQANTALSDFYSIPYSDAPPYSYDSRLQYLKLTKPFYARQCALIMPLMSPISKHSQQSPLKTMRTGIHWPYRRPSPLLSLLYGL
jgi:hypothetical protein